MVSVRPEKLFISPRDDSFENCVAARLENRLYVGDFIRYFFALPNGVEVVVKCLNDHAAPKISEGDEIELIFRGNDCFAFQARRT